jgi:glycine/D-amino acid oxidase-like deaminating enzyme/NADPH-dependent 2,4-dienoyl-CoA reductase/sulfur reductase-like enzyme
MSLPPATAAADAEVMILVDGVPVPARSGQTVAAALVAAGRQDFTRDVGDLPRGLFCGMGACHDCLVTVDGRTGQRACMTPVRAGMHVARVAPRPDLADPALAELAAPPPAIPVETVDVLVVGGGPAGLAAAETAAAAGAQVVLLDERTSPGGQYFKQPANAAARARLSMDGQSQEGRRLIDEVTRRGVSLRRETLVWGGAADADGVTIGALGPAGAFYVRPRQLIIAAGAYERPAPVPGGTLPGVMTTGAAQTLLRSSATQPGRRVIVTGNGPLNFQVAAELVAAGATVVAVVEAAPPPWQRPAEAAALVAASPALAAQGLAQLARLRAAGVPVLWGSEVIAIEGGPCATGVRVATPTGEARLAGDAVLRGGGFRPAQELSRLLGCRHEVTEQGLRAVTALDGESSRPDIHVIGEAARFAGAQVALAEGQLAGAGVAAKLGHAETMPAAARRQLDRARRFQAALWRLFAPATAPRRIADDALVCRCERVSAATLRRLVEAGAADIGALKRLSRAGMGRCQGRYCAPDLAAFTGPAGRAGETEGMLAPQMPLRPIPLAALAVEKPEWGGHRRALLPPAPQQSASPPLPLREVETLVIGAGICGLSTALFLAREGREVAVIDRGEPNGLASGGNAGSLHAQLLSFDHGARAEGGGGPAARTLPLQRDSIALWAELQRDSGRDIEMKVTGGVMVAESEAQLRFLAEKAAVERSVGIDCEVVDRATLQRLEPALADHFIGAAWCPQEGKINPLVATQAVRDLAVAAGAQLLTRADVIAIAAEGGGFTVTTARGVVRAKRVVNAAGGFASRIGAMLGLEVPVFGAPLQMMVTEAAAPALNGLVAHADRHLTLKQAANGNFIIGGGWTAGLDPVHRHPRPLLPSLEGNAWVAQHVVPGLRKLHVIRTWAAMNVNIDGAPILGEDPRCPGFFTAATSNGYTLGPLMGRLTAALVMGRDPGRDLAPFSIARFG